MCDVIYIGNNQKTFKKDWKKTNQDRQKLSKITTREGAVERLKLFLGTVYTFQLLVADGKASVPMKQLLSEADTRPSC